MSSNDLQQRTVPWFDARPNDTQITPDARNLLETYSKIPANDIDDHVVTVRDEAWKIFPYPCIGQFRFLNLSLKHTKEYAEILERLGKGDRLLDMACCFGQEIRQLTADGAPSENIYGCDLRKEYIELGYKLFADRDRLQAKFLVADIFDEDSTLSKLRGEFDIVYAGSFFHLFGYEDQVKVSKAVAKLLRPQKGSTILGRQVGALSPEEKIHVTNAGQKMFRHNPESFQKMWEDIGYELGVTFSVNATLHELPDGVSAFHTSDTRWIRFVIRRE